jgi:hypothetical protein
VTRTRPRPKTIAPRFLTKEEKKARAALPVLDDFDRPRKRGDCETGVRPCPYVSCKHHVYLDVNPETGSLRLTFPDLEVDELRETCSLDVAQRDGATLEQVGEIINLTRERIRQIEVRGLIKLKLTRVDDEPIPGDADYNR